MPGPADTEFFERAGMEDTRLRAMEDKDDPAEVARQGFEALMAGQDHVVAGSPRNRFQAAAARFHKSETKVSADESRDMAWQT